MHLCHEAIKGRSAQDVVSGLCNALIRLDADTKHIIFWADNCTVCLTFVNENWGPESITFKMLIHRHCIIFYSTIFLSKIINFCEIAKMCVGHEHFAQTGEQKCYKRHVSQICTWILHLKIGIMNMGPEIFGGTLSTAYVTLLFYTYI